MNRKKPFFCVVIAALCFTANAQPTKNPEKKTLLNKQSSLRIVTKAGINAAQADKNIAAMAQPSIGFLFNERFFAGISANFSLNERLLRDVSYQPVKDEASYWEFNYAGLALEYVFAPFKEISPAIGFTTGSGKVERNFRWNSLSKQSPEYAQLDKKNCRPGYFLFIEPSASINLNLSANISLKANAGYRFVNFMSNQNTIGITNSKFNGFLAGILIQFSGLLPQSPK